MCGRYTLKTPAGDLQEELALDDKPELKPRYNIAPSQDVAIVVSGPGRKLEWARWGLIPFWAKDEKIGYKMINARAETLAEKPAYREAVKHRRCLIPADGFYEWRKTTEGKVPVHIRRRGGRAFAFAGLWETWKPKAGGDPVRSCTIVTSGSNALIAPFHDRMPVIVPPARYARWLSAEPLSPDELADLARPYPAEELEAYDVSSLVNSPKNDAPDCVAPVAAGG